MVTSNLAKKLINICLSTGGDFAEIYSQKNTTSSYSMENEVLDQVISSQGGGVGIRIIKGLESVYGYITGYNKNELIDLATTLSLRFSGEQIKTVDKFLPLKVAKGICHQEIPYENVDKKVIIDKLRAGSLIMKEYSSDIIRRIAALSINVIDYEVFNSDKKHISNRKVNARIMANCVSSKNSKVQPTFNAKGTTAGWEFFENFDFNKLCEKTAKTNILMLNAKECPSGRMPVIIGNGFGGVLFHEACGHPLEASAVSKNLSCFSGKLGEAIASPIVNAFDDATIPNAWGSFNVDDEGHSPHKTQLIKNGICMDYLIDPFNGKRMNSKENGTSRRQSFRFEPTSRMSNTYIDNGTSTVEEIFKATKLGLYLVSFNGGSVDPSTGEFNFGASEAYIVRDGKIAEPVRGATLIGKGNEILFNIDMIANDLDLADGMCEAASGSIPVQVGQPTLRIKDITVGGAGGKLE